MNIKKLFILVNFIHFFIYFIFLILLLNWFVNSIIILIIEISLFIFLFIYLKNMYYINRLENKNIILTEINQKLISEKNNERKD